MNDIIITKREDGNGYDASYGELFCSRLTVDEALGVVASILFGGNPLYLKSAELREKLLVENHAGHLAACDSGRVAEEIANERLSQEAVSRVMAAIEARRVAA